MPAPDPALLKRTDWRLLLPWPGGEPFSSLVLLGGPPGLAEGLRETGIARHVEEGGAGPAPAAAVLSGGPAALARGADALAPGGVLYGETDDLASARQALEERGLEVLGTWAVWPGFEKPQVYIPLDAPRAVGWFGRTLYPAWTVRQRLLRGSLPLLERAPDRGARFLMRSFALTAVRPPANGGGPGLLGHPALPRGLREGSVPLLVTHGRERTVLMPFPREGRSPWGVLKVPRRPTLNGNKTVAEQEALTRLRQRLDPAVRSALPVPGGLLGWNGAPVGIESYLPGVSMVGPGLPWRQPSLRQVGGLRLAAGWLTEVHRETEEERLAWGPQARARWIEPLFEAVRRLGASEREERLFAAAGRRAESLAGLPLPVVWQHRNFTPWNLLRTAGPGKGELQVLDWEGARPGLPLCDLLHFVTHWHELARSAFDPRQRLRAFRELWTGRPGGGQAAGAALDAVALYCSRLRIDLRFLPLLLVVTWAELTSRPGSPGRLYLDALAGHGERLFAEER